jgi:tRNA (guanine26-N2/guanine27-N2)-dimethyltransferase
MNDISLEAAKLAETNVKLNNLNERVTVVNEDANLILSRYAAPRKRFDYVDIDPFGSPVPYLDSALRALRNNGLLALTATDMAPLCGVHPKACVRKYGGKPLRTEYCHELALRLLIGCLASVAAKHDVAVSPVFSYSSYNHVRTYAVVRYGAKQADMSLENMGYILHCFSCLHREHQKGLTPRLKLDCPECGSRIQTAGPLWLGTLWDGGFSAKIKDETMERNLRNRARIFQMVSLIIGEQKAPMTYYVVDKLCDKFNLPIPPLSKVMTGLRETGFQAVATHFSSKAVRTDAPASVVKEVVSKTVEREGSKMQETNIRRHVHD